MTGRASRNNFWVLPLLLLAACDAEPDPPPRKPYCAPAAFLVFFGWDSAELSAQGMHTLHLATNAYHLRPGRRIQCAAGTDTSGAEAYNMALSMRRVEAVKSVLIEEGLPSEAISCAAEGKSHLLVKTPDGVREPQNRRVWLTVVEADGTTACDGDMY